MSTQKMRSLTTTLYRTHREGSSKPKFRSKAHSGRESARLNYEELTIRSRDEQKELVGGLMTSRRGEWKHDYYRINKTFSLFPQEEMEAFPHNNKKYNVQFLERNLHGKSLKFPAKDWGYFEPPRDKLFSDHYIPLVSSKRKYNEDYELRTSLFGETWVDSKKERIMDQYRLQANPFRTPASNTLISTMHKQRNYRKL